jgi:hypothetical protein
MASKQEHKQGKKKKKKKKKKEDKCLDKNFIYSNFPSMKPGEWL